MQDKSNGYEAIAEAFAHARDRDIGPRVVRRWAERLPSGATIVDVGCGNGVPISQALIDMGFAVYGVDASPTQVAKFRQRFPDAPVECSAAEEASFFGRKFDGAVAWGLLFLLPAELQRAVIGKVAAALKDGGHFLFTSPREVCSWMDGMTDLPSVSLGHEAYARELTAHGLRLVGDDEDEGQNYYYFAVKDGAATK